MKEYVEVDEQLNDEDAVNLPRDTNTWNETMIRLYSGLNTMEEKLEFLVKNEALYQYRKADNDDRDITEERTVVDALLGQFSETYISNGTDEQRATVFLMLNRMRTQANVAALGERNRILAGLPADDADREKKADHLVRNSGSAMTATVVEDILEKFSDSYRDLENDQQKMAQQFPITDRTTMGQVAAAMGYEGQRLRKFFDKLQIEANTPAIAYYTERRTQKQNGLVPSAAEVRGIIYKDIRIHRLSNWENGAKESYLSEIAYTAQQKKDLKKFMQQKEDDPDTLYWINGEGNEKLREVDTAGRTAAMMDYYNRYVRTEAERDLKNTAAQKSAARIRGNTGRNYQWLIDPYEMATHIDPMNPDASYYNGPIKPNFLQMLKVDTHSDLADEANRWLENRSKCFAGAEVKERIQNVVDSSDANAAGALFTLWALGTHDHIRASNMMDIHENPDLVEEFARFCQQHPTLTATSKKSFRDSAKVWSDIMHSATEKIKSFKPSAVDYSDPVKAGKTLREYALLSSMSEFYLTEYRGCFKNNIGINGTQFVEESMGQDKWNEDLENWSMIRNLMCGARTGYLTKFRDDKTSNKNFRILTEAAAGRYILDSILQNNNGKKLGDIVRNERNNLRHIGTVINEVSSELYSTKGVRRKWKYKKSPAIPEKDFIEYMNGKNKLPLQSKFRPLLGQMQKECDQKISNEFCKVFYQQQQVDLSTMKDRILAVPENDAAAVKVFMKPEGNDEVQRKISQDVSAMINNYFSDECRNLLVAAGVTNKMDAFLIDGKTPEEIWGKKYKDVADAGLKERCLQFEILKKIADGNTEVRAKTVAFDKDGRLKVNGSQLVAPTRDMVKRFKYNYEVYKTAKNDMVGYMNVKWKELIRTHGIGVYDERSEITQAAIRDVGKIEGTNYKRFELAFRDCYYNLKDTKNCKPETVLASMKHLYEAAKKYKNDNSTEWSRKRKEERQKIASIIVRMFPGMISTYAGLRYGVSGDIACSDSDTLNHAPDDSIDGYMNILKENGMYRDIPNGPSTKKEKQSAYDSYKGITEDTLQPELKRIGRNFADLVVPPEKADAYTLAMSYYVKKVMDRTMNGQFSKDELNEKKERIRSYIRGGGFQIEAEALSRNPVFREYIRQNKGLDYQEWKAVERTSDEFVRKLTGEMHAVDSDGRDVAKYVLTGKTGIEGAAGGFTLGAVEKGAALENKRYQRLSDYVTKQILTDPQNVSIVNAICSRRMEYDDVVKSVMTCLKQRKVFDGQNYDIEGLREQITSGQLKNAVTETIRKQTTAKAKVAHDRILIGQDTNARRPAVNRGPGIHH